MGLNTLVDMTRTIVCTMDFHHVNVQDGLKREMSGSIVFIQDFYCKMHFGININPFGFLHWAFTHHMQNKIELNMTFSIEPVGW